MAKLYFRYAAMNAGKSTALLQAAHNYEERGMKVALFTAAHDDRSGRGVIGCASAFSAAPPPSAPARASSAWRCRPTSPACSSTKRSSSRPSRWPNCTGMAHVDGPPVLCYGLRGDFRGEAFPGSAKLLTLADELEEMKTICACGRKASMNMRIDAEGRRVLQGEQVLIGGNERYRAVCPACFYAADGVDPARAPGLFG
ncbi:MAG: thymidine kinase [Rubrivivax sp.]